MQKRSPTLWIWLGVVGVVLMLFWVQPSREGPRVHTDRGQAPTAAPTRIAPPPVDNSRPAVDDSEPPYEGIERLNAADRTIREDLALLNDVFVSWQTNFPRQGNPVGSNEEITAALTGDNRLRLVMIPRRHPAVNAQGQLIDRWGTPFSFHQQSGTRMEIRSAGPDKKLYSEDDEVLSP